MALIRVVRDHPNHRHPLASWAVYVDDERVGAVKNGQHIDCHVGVGEHAVHIGPLSNDTSDRSSNRLLCSNRGDDIVTVMARPVVPGYAA
jgi:hypothetical protein